MKIYTSLNSKFALFYHTKQNNNECRTNIQLLMKLWEPHREKVEYKKIINFLQNEPSDIGCHKILLL